MREHTLSGYGTPLSRTTADVRQSEFPPTQIRRLVGHNVHHAYKPLFPKCGLRDSGFLPCAFNVKLLAQDLLCGNNPYRVAAMMTLTSETIITKLQEASDSLRRLDEQRLRQWIAILQRRPGDEVFNALIRVFSCPDRPHTRNLDQEYAGRLLLAVKPPCPSDVEPVLRRVLHSWDVSVEQLPFYFEAVMGRDALLQALDKISWEGCSQQEQKAIDTFRFWVGTVREREGK